MSSLIRSALFVPASRPERIPKALASGADMVIIDLEDGVAEADKAEARGHLTGELGRFLAAGVPVGLRINGAGSEHCGADLELCAAYPELAHVVIPKAEDPAALQEILSYCPQSAWAQIESVRGLSNLPAIAALEGVCRFSYGPLDLALDLGVVMNSPGGEAMLDQMRFTLVMQSRLAGLEAPLAGTLPVFDDPDLVAGTARRAREMGFGGMLCIHPAQLGPVNEAFSPSVAELEWARRVIELAEQGLAVFLVDGRMVDAPAIERARQLLGHGG